MAKGEELKKEEEMLKKISLGFQNHKGNEKSLGEYRLLTFDTSYSVKDFTDLIFNPILGLNNDLIKQISLRSASSKEWIKRVNQLKKIYFSIRSIKTASTYYKKTIQISIELRGNGIGSNINDTKPLIVIKLY